MKKLVIVKNDLEHNYKTIQSICKKAQVIPVLKGNGYGLGICELANFLAELGVTMFAVSELSEAQALRQGGIEQEILLLSPTENADEARTAAELDITCAVGSVAGAKALADTGKEVRAHIKIDTGFGRYGFLPEELGEASKTLKSFKNIEYTGVFSHFSNSFGKKEQDTRVQLERFEMGVEQLKQHGIQPKMRHIANSSAALRFPQTHYDAVRIGSALLGRLVIPNTYGLKRIAKLEAQISAVRTVPKGHNIGYANTYKTKRATKIAVVPVGYMDGYGVEKVRDTFRPIDILRYMYQDFRSLGRRYTAAVNGMSVPVIGRVSMYNIVLDVTGVEVKPGDTAVMECNPILIDSKIVREYI